MYYNIKRILSATLCAGVFFNMPVFAAQKWYEGEKLVAHALGVVENRAETNSLEAFMESYEKGIRVMEADFSITSDGVVVVRHDFDQDSYYNLEQTVLNGSTAMDINRYVNEKICFKYTPLTLESLLNLMVKYDDVYIITDTKYTDAENVLYQFRQFVSTAEKLGATSVLDRIIVQIYNDEMLNTVKSTYPFQNFIYTLYQTSSPDFNHIASFCTENGIETVTMNIDIVDSDNVAILKESGLKVYAHTVNRLLDVQKAVSAGCVGVYTDILTPESLSYIDMAVKKSIPIKINSGKKLSSVECFDINGVKYMPVNDVVKMISEAGKETSVTNNTNNIVVTTGAPYVDIGNEMKVSGGYVPPSKTDLNIIVNGADLGNVVYSLDGRYFVPFESLVNTLGVPFEGGDVIKLNIN